MLQIEGLVKTLLEQEDNRAISPVRIFDSKTCVQGAVMVIN